MSDEVKQDEFKTVRGKTASAWKIGIYGVPSVGKSELASKAPGAFFIDLENGLDRIDCWRTPEKVSTYEGIIKWMTWVSTNDEVKTLVFDTIDELEKILQLRAVRQYNGEATKHVKTFAEIPWGKGPDFLVQEWRDFIDIVDRLRARGKNIIFVGHEAVQKFANPMDSDFNYFSPNIEKKAIPVFMAKMDALLYGRFETFVSVDGKTSKGKAAATGKRILLTTQGASWTAKNRFGLPSQIDLDATLFDQLK